MAIISEKSAKALHGAISQRGKSKGLLLAKAPPSNTLAYAAWHGAMMVCNPYKVSIAGMIFMSDEQREVFREVEAVLESIGVKSLDRDRNALQRIGAW
jgi:hypothetical protein